MRFKNKSTDITILQLGVWCATSINVCEASVSRRNFMEMQSINFFRLLNLLCWFFLFDLANRANDSRTMMNHVEANNKKTGKNKYRE